jgi:hypothetical protein
MCRKHDPKDAQRTRIKPAEPERRLKRVVVIGGVGWCIHDRSPIHKQKIWADGFKRHILHPRAEQLIRNALHLPLVARTNVK